MIVPVGDTGAVGVFNGSAGGVQVLIDVTGYIADGTATADGMFVPVTPARIADSRVGQQIPHAVPASGTATVQATNLAHIPANAAAVVLTVTAVDPDRGRVRHRMACRDGQNGHLEPELRCGTDHPEHRHRAGRHSGSAGKISFYNGSGGSVHLLVDVSGYLLGGSPAMAGAFASVTPARIADSRANLQLQGAVPGYGVAQLQINGRGGLPATGVAAVVLTVTAVSPTDAGYLTVWPAGIARTATSNLNFVAGQTIPNTVIVPVSSIDTGGPGDTVGKISIFNGSAGPVQVAVDVTGYILFAGAEPS